MHSNNDNLLSRLTVKIRQTGGGETLGTGIIYSAPSLQNKIYVLTAAHVLFEDVDQFEKPFEQIELCFFSKSSNSYKQILAEVSEALYMKDTNKDVAVFVLDKDKVQQITGELQTVSAVRDRQSVKDFILKGFPNATQGIELDSIQPVWKQAMTEVNKFQLTLKEDYSEWSTGGFSGSGIFLHDHNKIYLYGVFTRFRKQELGKVIYAQYLETFNELLLANYLPTIRFVFLGQFGLSKEFLEDHVKLAIKNLGPRFNAELNYRMPIAKLFNDLAKDELFKKKVLESFHKWLLKNDDDRQFQKSDELSEIGQNHLEVVDFVRRFVDEINWSPEISIDLSGILKKINKISENVEAKISELSTRQFEIIKDTTGVKRDPYAKKPFDFEIEKLRGIETHNYNLISNLDNIDIHLSNHPVLLIKGEAGCGKSHLLGDIACQRINQDKPVLLLLGQHFRKEKTVWQNIIDQLDFKESKEKLLVSLNEIGKQVGSRFLILIDALNEGAGKDLWPNELAGFVADIMRYSNLGVAMTVRTTYWNSVIPSTVQNDKSIRIQIHYGFKGNEYEALKLFCEYYKLTQPKFPILSPEFTNPLFLQLICEGLNGAGEKYFPQGFQGFDRLFDYYLKAVHKKLSERREEYTLKAKITEKAIEAVATEAFKRDYRMLPLEDAVELFEKKFPINPTLLMDLIQENVFIRTIHSTEKSIDQEYVYFAYERFGDFFISKKLLMGLDSKEDVIKAFKEGQVLGLLIKEDYWNKGVLETLAILLPEKYGLEITEVYEWYLSCPKPEAAYTHRSINEWLLGSLKWRSINSIVPQKITDWLNSRYSTENYDDYINRLIELSAVHGHFFNSDRLHNILIQHDMSKRDAYLQKFFLNYGGQGGHDPYPLSRLLDWAWQPGISSTVDYETARLTAQTLVWLLSCTIRKLRDRTTKALVNLLEEQPSVLVRLLTDFNEIDDAYIKERLYAVAYGCILRVGKEQAVALIAQKVYDQIFKSGNPPSHVLLRDYARNTVEYAISKNIQIDCYVNLIRPPYQSKWPSDLPTNEEISVFDKDGEHPPYSSEQVRIYNQIHFSTIAWDFGRKIIDPAFSDFEPQRYTLETEYKAFLKSIPVKKRRSLKAYLDMYKTCFEVREVIRISPKMVKERLKERQEFIAMGEEIMGMETVDINKYLDKTQLRYIKDIIIPHIEDGSRKLDFGSSFNVRPVKNWIVKRAHELGYDIELHYGYDSMTESYNNRMGSKVERIGKKYQWIAFYEIFGIVADHFKMQKRYSHKSKPVFFQGPWEKYLRNIDPAFITQRSDEYEDGYEEEKDELGVLSVDNEWWIDKNYAYWNQDNASWVGNSQDLPDPKLLIQRSDESNIEWLYLGVNANWYEPVPFGVDKYKRVRKDVWYMISAYLVKRGDKGKAVKWLSQQNFYGRWLPEPDQLTGLYNRENYWSPISIAELKGKISWITLDGSNLKVLLTTAEAVGEMSEDKSGAHFGYLMPSKEVFDGMKLQYAAKDGNFKNENGEIVVININPKGVMVRKKDFLEYLNLHDLEVIWTLCGEKSANGQSYKDSFRNSISGVYFLTEQEQVTGNLKVNGIE